MVSRRLCCYLRTRDGPLRAYGLMVVTLSRGRIVAIIGFPDTACSGFGLPRTLPEYPCRRGKLTRWQR